MTAVLSPVPTLGHRLRTRAYNLASAARRWWYVNVFGMTIGHDCRISGSARLDRTNPRGVHIGNSTLVSFDAAILTHDFVGGRHFDTYVGDCCFIGARSIIMPGVRVGDHCVIGSGSVVTSDIPSHSVAAGNPARILHRDIVTGRWGIRNPKFLVKEGIIPALPDA